MPLQQDIDLLNPPRELEKRMHKRKRLVQCPNSFFMDVKCQGCFTIQVRMRDAAYNQHSRWWLRAQTQAQASPPGPGLNKGFASRPAEPRQLTCSTRHPAPPQTVFSHSQSVIACGSCGAVLAQPSGGKCRCVEATVGP